MILHFLSEETSCSATPHICTIILQQQPGETHPQPNLAKPSGVETFWSSSHRVCLSVCLFDVPSPNFSDRNFFLDNSLNIFKLVQVPLFGSVERVCVSRMQDFLLNDDKKVICGKYEQNNMFLSCCMFQTFFFKIIVKLHYISQLFWIKHFPSL